MSSSQRHCRLVLSLLSAFVKILCMHSMLISPRSLINLLSFLCLISVELAVSLLNVDFSPTYVLSFPPDCGLVSICHHVML